MEKEFVPYGLSLRLKALGFDEPCFRYYHKDLEEDKILLFSDNEYFMQGIEFSCNAPTFSQAFRWFREKYDWTIKINQVTKNNWSYTIENFPNERTYYGQLYESYEEAELACLDKLIEIVESKEKEI